MSDQPPPLQPPNPPQPPESQLPSQQSAAAGLGRPAENAGVREFFSQGALRRSPRRTVDSIYNLDNPFLNRNSNPTNLFMENPGRRALDRVRERARDRILRRARERSRSRARFMVANMEEPERERRQREFETHSRELDIGRWARNERRSDRREMDRVFVDLDNSIIEDLEIVNSGDLESIRNEENKEENEVIEQEKVNSDCSNELGILTCTICYSLEFKGIKICRFCSSSACNPCWAKVLTTSRKCPFCRKQIKALDLVKSKLASDLKEYKEKQTKEFDKNCSEHDKPGNIFCETCSDFLCTSCLTGGTHNGHTLKDVEEDIHLKRKLRHIQNFKNKIQSVSKNLNVAISDHIEFCDSDNTQLEQIADEFRKKAFEAIDKCLEDQKKKLSEEKSKYEKANCELNKVKEAQSEVFKGSYRKLDAEEVQKSFNSALEGKKSTKIHKLISQDQIDFETSTDFRKQYELSLAQKEGENFSVEFRKELEKSLQNLQE